MMTKKSNEDRIDRIHDRGSELLALGLGSTTMALASGVLEVMTGVDVPDVAQIAGYAIGVFSIVPAAVLLNTGRNSEDTNRTA